MLAEAFCALVDEAREYTTKVHDPAPGFRAAVDAIVADGRHYHLLALLACGHRRAASVSLNNAMIEDLRKKGMPA